MKKTYFIEMWDARKQQWCMQGRVFNAATDADAAKKLVRMSEASPLKTFQLVRKDDNRWLGYAVAPMPQARKEERREVG